MNKKLQTGIGLFIYLFCASVFAEKLQLGPVYTEVEDQVSFIVTFPTSSGITSPKATEFKLIENDKVLSKADDIERLDQSNKGLVLLLCIDVSGSMQKKVLKEIQDALTNLLTTARQKDKYGLVTFADEVIIQPEITNERDTLLTYISNLKNTGKKTVLFQAIFKSLDTLEQYVPNEYRRILVISDGKNEDSDSTFVTPDSLINLSRSYGIPIDAIGRGTIDEQYSEGLRGLANATGGHFILADPKTTSLKDAITRMYKTFMETAWVVNFRYQTNAEQPAVENAVIKFERDDSLSFSANIDQSIPRPVSNSPFWEKKLFLYLGFILLLLVTLIFIWWIIKKQQEAKEKARTIIINSSQNNIDNEGTSNSSQTNKQGRQTEVAGSNSTPPLQSGQNQPNIPMEGIEGLLVGQHILMDKHTFQIGADTSNDLILADDAFVSGNHALLSYDNGTLILSDQDSLNGTLLNGASLNGKTSQVFPGDIIQIGKSSFRIMAF